MIPPARLELIAVPGLPLIAAGDDLPRLIHDALSAAGQPLVEGDIVVIAQKIVSKAEGRRIRLADVEPSAEALALAGEVGKDPRLIELILTESRRIVRKRPGVLIVEHRLGLVMANAGIDQSNIGGAESDPAALLLPLDPDASAARLAEGFSGRAGVRVGVVINDSFGRPWRQGTVGVAIGAAGLAALVDRRGDPDLFGRTLRVTVIAHADEIAAAASLLMGQADEGRPAVVVRGLASAGPEAPARALIRPAGEDLFR
ncbi:coenzyme F420-0:L-glutamate ligase [Ancylobacter terrae]|uniref:coenzyme F420-0:L-glutamate ligase n=1 Tax=Ancylobacter sp. sgz301288 TaxID=3342077 RepID=UPI00385BC3C2